MSPIRKTSPSTCRTLLQQAQTGSAGAWTELVAIYRPYLFAWLTSWGLPHHESEDLTQETLAVVARELGSFEHSGRPGAFRCWLRRILVRRARAFWRRERRRTQIQSLPPEHLLGELEDSASESARRWDMEHDLHVVRTVLARLETQFDAASLTAFRRLMFDEAPPVLVAQELGMTVGAVYSAKSRVLRRLRTEAGDLLGNDG